MRKIIIISHKTMARGVKDTLSFFTDMQNDIYEISAYENGQNSFPTDVLENILEELKNNQIFIFTDMLGGSVNQNVQKYINENVFVLTGFNLTLCLSILLYPEKIIDINTLKEIIHESRDQMILMNDYIIDNDSIEDE